MIFRKSKTLPQRMNDSEAFVEPLRASEPSYLGPDTAFDGNLVCDGEIHIDCELRGTIQADTCLVDVNGNVYFTDRSNSVLRKISSTGIITTVAGNGSLTFNGDNIPATSAQLNQPIGLCADSGGNIYCVNYGYYRVRKIDVFGTIADQVPHLRQIFTDATGKLMLNFGRIAQQE